MALKPNLAWLYGLDPVPTGAQHFNALESQWAYLIQQIGADQLTTVEIVTGTLTPDRGEHLVDTEGQAGTDDLSNIAATNIDPTRTFQLRLWAADPARAVTVKHLAGGSGQISLRDAADYTIDSAIKWIELEYRSGSATWFEVARGQGTAAYLDSGAGDAEVPTNADLKGSVRSYTKQQGFAATQLAYAANVAWNLDDNQVAWLQLTGSATLDNPSWQVHGHTYQLFVMNDGVGGHSLSFGSQYIWPDNQAPVMPSAAGAGMLLTFVALKPGATTYLVGVEQQSFVVPLT